MLVKMEVLSSTEFYGFFPTENSPPGTPRDHPALCRVDLKRSGRKTAGISLTHQPFEEITPQDTYSWNNLIQRYVACGDATHAILTYRQMVLQGIWPDKHTFPRTVTASRLWGDLWLGKQVHCLAVKHGFHSDHYVVTSLIEMYGRLDSLDAARLVFDKNPCKNSVSWTILARLLLERKEPKMAMDIFGEMVCSGMEVDPIAMATAIVACGRLKSLHEGRKVYEIAKKCCLESDILVSNSLMRMFLDCGSTDDARKIFFQMPSKDVISWTTIIRGSVKEGGYSEGLKLFKMMVTNGIVADALLISSILPACARMTACKNGKEIHGHLLRSGIDVNVKVQNAMIDMYMKSGCIEYAAKIFAGIKHRDTISWTVMILGYSLHGRGKLAMDMFCKMDAVEIEIDELAYAAILYACAAAGLVDEGKSYFNRIQKPKLFHHTQMVSVLAIAGLFDEASAFIQEWHIERHPEVIRAMLEGCRVHCYRTLGKRLAEQLCDSEPLNADNYILLSNWYAHAGKWDAVERFKETIMDMGLKPQQAYSWIEYRNKIHVFGTADMSHPISERIYRELEQLTEKMRNEGYQCDLDFSLHDVDGERECGLIGHSEMLAVSFGLINSKAGETIRVTKNHRICHGCHDALRAFSKILQREILVKDLNIFHHFKNGHCSCFNLSRGVCS